MKLRLISLASAVVMLLTLAVGCAGTGTSNPSGGKTPANENTAQLVVAMNPILVYDDGETVIPYNDVKNAIKADFEGSTLTTLSQSTPYNWMYNTASGWKKRAVYTLDNWTNGSGAEAKTAFSYAYNNERTTSLASYYAQSTELTTYSTADSVPDYGLLLSVTGSEEEALTYTIQKDGVLNVAEGAFTAVQSVAGVNTGFLAEDGTARSASVRILVNDVQIFSGTLCNSTAAPDGVAVTSLKYDQLSDIAVKAGSTLLIAVKLDATANRDEDQSAGEYNEDDNWTTVNTEVKVPVTGDESNGGGDTVKQESEALTIFDGFDSRFVIVRSIDGLSTEMNNAVVKFRENMEYILDAEVLARNEGHDEKVYEIVVGPMEGRPESVKIYNELLGFRANNANDYIIRRVGTKVYISALNVETLNVAFDYFLKTFCSDDKGAIPANYDYTYQADVISATIAGVNIGNYAIRTEKNPTTMVYRGAQELQVWIRENCGYLLPVTPMTDDGKHYEHEIQIGPMNGDVHVYREYDTRFTSKTTESVGKFSVDPSGFMEDKDMGYYKAAVTGDHLVVSGGSTYAVNAAMEVVCNAIRKDKSLPRGYAIEGTYKPGTYALTGGYDLAWQDDFNYTGTDREIDKEVREYYSISSDTTPGPTILSAAEDGTITWDQQRRPGVYGENWWIWQDKSTGNGYLLEITKKEDYGYDAGRLISANKWAFRYGIWETRIVVGTRNGACSAVWASSSAPDQPTVRNEFDLYENFGRDLISACFHTWAPENLGGHKQEMGGINSNPVFPAEGEQFWDTFHSIAMEWTPDEVTFLWDGVAFDYCDLTDKVAGQSSTTIKFANGVGTQSYSKGFNPDEWMDEAYTAATGKTVKDFFEVQTIDYSYIFQTSNEGKNALQKSYIKYDRSHPSNAYYTGYLSKVDGYVSAQTPVIEE